MTDPQPTQADREAAVKFLDVLGFPQYAAWLVDGKQSFKDDGGEKALAIFTRHADERETQVIAAVVAWLRCEQGKGSDDGVDYADGFADQIEAGCWKGPRHAE